MKALCFIITVFADMWRGDGSNVELTPDQRDAEERAWWQAIK
jgi:hypothetical protein